MGLLRQKCLVGCGKVMCFLRFIIGYVKFSCIGAVILTGPAGCQSSDSKSSEGEAQYISTTDQLGYTITLPSPALRVMGTSPAMTEMLYAICPDSQIVAISHRCDYPARAIQKPVVNTYPLDLEAILMHKPHVVFSEEGITSVAHAERLKELGVPTYFFKYGTVEDIYQALLTIGELTGNHARANYVVDSLRAVQQRLVTEQVVLDTPRVLAITWRDPIYVHGKNTIMTDKLRLAGAHNAVEEVFAKNYPELSREYSLKMNPDVVLGGSFERMDSTFFLQYPELKKIDAYRNKRVYSTTDNLTSRPSPRVMQSVEELKRLIHAPARTATSY
jgi:iron complex transport system substrate-binding protein